MSINVKDVIISGLTGETVKIDQFLENVLNASGIIGMGRNISQRRLRNRIRFLKQLYPNLPDRLIDRFLDIRPTITELRKVLYFTRLKLPARNRYSYIRTRSRDILKQALRQQVIMENIIRSRSFILSNEDIHLG
jgi:hypothetical protein